MIRYFLRKVSLHDHLPLGAISIIQSARTKKFYNICSVSFLLHYLSQEHLFWRLHAIAKRTPCPYFITNK